MKIKKSYFIKIATIIIIVGLIGFAGTLVANTKNNVANANSDAAYNNVASEEQDKVKLKKEMRIDLLDSTDTPKISKEEAIAAANQEAGVIKDEATKIVATYHLMTYQDFTMFSEEVLNANPKLREKGYIDKLPVWIVSYKGLQLPAKGGFFPHAKAKPKNNTEFNVVVDAASGKPLISYRPGFWHLIYF